MADLVNPYDLTDPQKEFWDRAQGFQLTPDEQAEADDLVKKTRPSVLSVAVAIGGAYLLYRRYMTRNLKEELPKTGADAASMRLMASAIYQSFLPAWTAIVVPALIKGYVVGVRESKVGRVPDQYLYDIATAYAKDLGQHMNDVSMDAMMRGYHAQVNRKVPPARAAQQVASVYGVPPRTMNALISVWNTEDKRKLAQVPIEVARDTRAKALADKAAILRARQMGEHEAWVAKSQAKQIVWMYGVNTGTLPKDSRRVWVTADDEKVCQVCGPMHELSAPVNVKFKTKSGDFWSPPTHVNCRCDIILDVDVTEGMESELQRMVESEPVHKAMYKDRYDRDRRGRFSEVESRLPKKPEIKTTYKEIKPIKLQDLWEQADTPEKREQLEQILAEARERYAQKKTSKTKSTSSLKSAPLASGLKSSGLGHTSSLKTGSLKPIQQEEHNLTSLKSGPLSQPGKSALNANSSKLGTSLRLKPLSTASIKAAMPEALRKPVETSDGDNWIVLDEPMFVVLNRDQISTGTDGTPTFITTSEEYCYMGDDELNREIRDHWGQVEEQMIDLFDEEGPLIITLDAGPGKGKHSYIVDKDALDEIIASSINGEHSDIANTVYLQRQDANPDSDQPLEDSFSASSVAYKIQVPGEGMSIVEYVESNIPLVFALNHGFPGQFEIHSTKYGSYGWNSGKWVGAGEYRRMGDVSMRPYTVHYALPIDQA